MRIGELAAKAGVSVRALRYYEEQGLLAAERSAGGTRHYPDTAVDQVWMIQQFYSAGLASRSIRAILPHLGSDGVTPEVLALLQEERERVDLMLVNLADVRDRLDTGIAVAAKAVGSGKRCPAETRTCGDS
ncbi:MerR family transcriptional regulator [Umezawaea endophytica]|uniref:MerR family transcriptional regulator n=1 Tax=Umezawaea endophytica TaxID=1654476 RepID=A0A9X2VJE4_9PSEU|nr:MerR family transcriptional regulator [Umezawaea endophytica]MCS7477730.1 MerR family transcriptional regulator [Umezawaea endophytica]